MATMSESEDWILKQRKYSGETEETLRREFQETQREERQKNYTQEDVDRLKEQAEQSQKDNK
jgi:hypothetical protein